MNRKPLIAALALAAASVTGFAANEVDELTGSAQTASTALTRDEVRAELLQLREAGALPTVNEASPSQLDANVTDARVAELQAIQVVEMAEAQPAAAPESLPAEDALDPLRSEDERIGTGPDAATGPAHEHLMFVSPQGTVVIIESVPQDAAPQEESLPFEHPALPGDAR